MHVHVVEDRGWTVVIVRGVVDVASAPELLQTLQEVQFGGSGRILVDLDQVELLDSYGIGVLVDAHKRARSHDSRLVVLVTRERLRHVLERAGLDAMLQLVAEADEVLAPGDPSTPADTDDGADR
ncbi:MAG: STAS domain-containing protein [Nitriliruptor sp.]|uniref:STAS domain-containing protein n=1 Tax=Nitriliruptor sp. TaxID=2448056 RepID=UPI0034A04C55